MKKVSIIITTYNQNTLLEKCIDSIRKKTDYKNYKIFLIDDGSLEKIGEKIKKKFPFVDVTINKSNLGFSKSNNIGIKKALRNYNPDYILLLNDDIEIVQRNWLKEIIKIAESDKKIGILGCRIIYPDGSLQWFAKNSKIFFFTQPGNKKEESEILKIQKVDNVIGAFFLIKKEVITRIGFFDEKFSPFYGEDTDFCYRASKAGFNIIYVGSIKVIHARNKSISKFPEDYIWYIRKRNSIRLEWLNFDLFNIIKHSLIHFGSVFVKKQDKKIMLEKNILKKLFLLFKAYIRNTENLNEIIKKASLRNRQINKF